MSDNKYPRAVRRIRSNHGSMLVTIPPAVARAAGIHFGDYVEVGISKVGKKIYLRKIR